MTRATASRRFLIAAGTANYSHFPALEPLSSVPADLTRIQSLFCGQLGYRRALPELGLDPTANELRHGVSGWLNAPERTADDILVVYYSGHAVSSGRHYLLCRDSKRQELAGTAVASEDLMWAVGRDSPVRHILVILDTCYAGAGVRELSRIAERVEQSRPETGGTSSGLWFLAAARPQEEALESVFSQKLAAVISSLRAGYTQPYLSLDWVVSDINAAFEQSQLRQRAFLGAQEVVSLPPFIDNPDYDPEAGAGLDVEGRRRQALVWREDRDAHWDPRSRGVQLRSDPGQYFSGRVRALSELVAWLSDPDADAWPRIVTGDPGSGKSAVLARIVMLSDAEGRRRATRLDIAAGTDPPAGTLPPQGIVDVAVHARNRTEAQVLQMLADGFAVQAASTPGLIGALSEMPRRRAAVIDAVDEASSPAELIERVLRPLIESTSATGVKLLLGIRKRAARAFPGRKVLIDLDDSKYLGVDDLAGYVRQVLLAENEPAVRTPYRDNRRPAAQVARAVAARASPTFLIARIEARNLLTSSHMVDLAQPGWDERFPATVGHAFDGYLKRCGMDEELVRAVLAPLAWAEGSGLPKRLWPPLASALAPGYVITDQSIDYVHQIAGEYITESRVAEEPVYRLYHHALAEHLQGEREPRALVEIQERISRRLIEATPPSADGRPDWLAAHPYVRAHLPTHASATSQLSRLILQAGFLLAASPDRLLPALPVTAGPPESGVVAVYQECVHQLRDGPLALAAAYLELAARKRGEHELADDAARVCGPLPWRARWAHWQYGRTSRLLGRCDGAITAMTAASLHGQVVVVVGDEEGGLCCFDLARGRPHGELVRAHEGAVAAVTSVSSGGRRLVISGGADGLRVSEITTRGLTVVSPEAVVAAPGGRWRGKRPSAVTTLAACEVDGPGHLVVSGERDGTTRFWRLAGTELSFRLAKPGRSQVNALAAARYRDRAAVVSADADGFIRIWDANQGVLLKEQASGSGGGVNAIAVVAGPDRDLIVSGGADGLVQPWDLDLNRVGASLAGHRLGVHTLTAMAGGANGGNIAIFSGGADETLHTWRRDGLAWLAGPPVRHRDGVRALTVAEPAGKRSVVLSAGGDSRVRAWEVSDLMSRDPGSAMDGRAVRAVAAITVGGQPVVLAAGDDGVIAAFDAASGAPLQQAPVSHRLTVRALAVTGTGPRPLVVSAGDDETLRLWEFGAGTAATVVTDGVVTCMAIVPGLSVLAAGGEDGQIRLCRLGDGRPLDRPVAAHRAGITALTAVDAAGRSAVVSADAEGEVRLTYLASSPETSHMAEHDSQVRALCVAGSGHDAVIASGCDDGVVRLWRLPGGRPAGRRLAGKHQGAVTALAAMGGQEPRRAEAGIVSGGQDGVVCVRTPGEHHMIETGSPVTSLAVLGDGVIAGTESGLLFLQFPR